MWYQEERQRRAKLEEDELPSLWILASTLSKPVLQASGAIHLDPDLAGIYTLSLFKLKLVAINQLPQTEETLWIRVLGRDRVQEQAIAEIQTLPPEDPRRQQTLKLLVAYKVIIDLEGLGHEPEGIMMKLTQIYQEWEQKTEQRGEQRGKSEGEQNIILAQLEAQLGLLNPTVVTQIQQLSSPQLQQLAIALLDFQNTFDLETYLSHQE